MIGCRGRARGGGKGGTRGGGKGGAARGGGGGRNGLVQSTLGAPLRWPRLGTVISVPGRWWNNASAAERAKLFPCQAVEIGANHEFGGGRRSPGVRLDLLESFAQGAAAIPDGGGWMTLKAWCEYSDAHGKRARDAEIMQRAEQIMNTVTDPSEQDADTGAAAEGEALEDTHVDEKKKYDSLVRKFFTGPIRVEEITGGSGLRFIYQCRLDEQEVAQWGPKVVLPSGKYKATQSTGRLSAYLRKWFWPVFETYIVGKSPHVSTRIVDGSIVNYYSFRAAAASHIQYVLMCAADARPFALGKSDAFRAFLDKIDPRYRPPHRQVCAWLLALDLHRWIHSHCCCPADLQPITHRSAPGLCAEFAP